MTASERGTASTQARALLERQPLWQRARTILFFAPLPQELDIWPLLTKSLAAGKLAGLPRFVPETQSYLPCRVEDPTDDIRVGRFGIREPQQRCSPLPIKLDLTLVPGVAFDLHGRRLGRGKGFYDRLLAAVHGTTCGVAFDEQIVCTVPVEPHDVQLNCILTPTRWIEL